MLRETIINNWRTGYVGRMHIIADLENTDYPAWTISLPDSYGVAIPYIGDEAVNEDFAHAKIKSSLLSINENEPTHVLLLTTDKNEIMDQFAFLCEAFIDPGEDGKQRAKIEKEPLSWWKEWKELLGNRDVNESVYDVLGELCGLLYAVHKYGDAKWDGPEGATYDIETKEKLIEVKSTIKRSEREIEISSQRQLSPPKKPEDLVFCVFEPVLTSGISIDSIMKEFEAIDYDTDLINSKIEKRGLETGMSARREQFILHEMLLYKVDQSFPRITPESFIGGVMPEGITKITYTVDLSGLTSISLMQGDTNDL